MTSELALKLFVGIHYGFRDYPGIGDNRHEVAVSLPAWNDVTVDVVVNPGTSHLPDVRPYIKSGWLEHFSQYLDTVADYLDMLVELLRGQPLQTGYVTVGGYQQVTRIVGIAI